MLDNDKANIFSILSFYIVPFRFYVLIKIISLYWLFMQYEFSSCCHSCHSKLWRKCFIICVLREMLKVTATKNKNYLGFDERFGYNSNLSKFGFQTVIWFLVRVQVALLVSLRERGQNLQEANRRGCASFYVDVVFSLQ